MIDPLMPGEHPTHRLELDLPKTTKTNGKAGNGQQHQGPPPELPELVINGADPTATAKELAAMFASRSNFLSNGYVPVLVSVDADNMPRAIEVSAEAVRIYAHEICRPMKWKDGELVPVPLSRDIALLFLNGLEGRWGLKIFRGITTAPILTNDGIIRIADGYDPETGLWCRNIPDLNIPERPTEADAKASLLRLRRFFRTFPFADGKRAKDPALDVDVIDLSQPPGLDESIFLTALLTAVVRQSLDLAPAFLCDAPSYSGAGTGKGLLVKAICIIAGGVKPSAFTSGHDAQEMDKRLTAALTQAHPAVFLDNFNSKQLTSDILASVLTESPAMVRPMGHTKTVPLHTRTFIGITGNNVEIAEDMARRVLKTHLDAQLEDPEQRKFAPGFLDSVLAARSALLSDALTIWRWGRQTVLKPGKPLGSFEVWAQWCRDPLIAIGVRDSVDRIAEIKAADPKRRAAVEFFDVWWAIHKDVLVKASDVSNEVIFHIDEKAHKKEDGSIQFSRQRVARFLKCPRTWL
jgi:putative DNA primase/helicase